MIVLMFLSKFDDFLMFSPIFIQYVNPRFPDFQATWNRDIAQKEGNNYNS